MPGPGRKFTKGQSGNPGGRRAMPADVKAIFTEALPEVALKLVQTALDRNHDDHVKAAAIVIERVLGKVAQPLTGTGGIQPTGNHIDLSVLDADEFRQFRALCMKAKKEAP